MIRGTTQDFTFKIPYDYNNDVALITVVFWQKGNDGSEKFGPLPIRKYYQDCKPDKDNGQVITVTLNPDETARFLEDRKAYVQLTGTTHSGIRFGCTEREIVVYPIYDDNILGDITPPSESNGMVIFDAGSI